MDLNNYMKSVANEAWAKGNPRLLKFIEESTLEKTKSSKYKRDQVNTRDRYLHVYTF